MRLRSHLHSLQKAFGNTATQIDDEKERPEFHDEFSEAEFFGFAKSYLSEAFPNPQRTGCPPDSDLHRMAEHPVEARDAYVSEHLTCCSPCFNRYMGILVGLKRQSS